MDVDPEESLPVASLRDDGAESVPFEETVGVDVGPSVVAINVESDGPPGLSNPDLTPFKNTRAKLAAITDEGSVEGILRTSGRAVPVGRKCSRQAEEGNG
ncbi:hypothetical protein Neosp_005406 [[Neocosmospora] mangrovei]